MLSLGIFSVAWWPWLPSFWVSCGLFVVLLSVSVLFRLKSLIWLIALSAGMLWGIFFGHQLLNETLPEKHSGKEFVITGQIVSLVDSNAVRRRFTLAPETIQLIDDPHQKFVSEKLGSAGSW
jgi:predicted membrane metal-binding protein